MLSAEKFISGMEMLKSGYVGWQFDTKNEMQVKMWYSVFKNLTDEQFARLIREYYAHNRKPPMSARDLTEILVDKFYATAKVPPEKGLDTVRDIINKNGGWEYGRSGIYKDLDKQPKALLETVIEFEGTLSSMPANDPYIAERFRKAYATRLRASAVREVDKRLGIALPEPKLPSPLGTSALPYEV